MYRIRKQFKFEAAHILESSYSKCCQQLHGHSYKLEVFITSEKLNEDGMVIDFGQLKDKLSKFLEVIDHTCFLPKKKWGLLGPPNEPFYFEANPTAENMAQIFYEHIKRILDLNKLIKLEKVRVHETSTGYAEFSEEK